VSQVEPVSSPDPEPLPARPPSRPSRVPLLIWGGIALFCLTMFGGALVLYLWSRDELESRDLKKATAFKITYVLKRNQTNTVDVTDPAAVKDLADALEITSTMMGAQFSTSNSAAVDVTLPGGKSARLKFVSPTQLDRAGWGMLMVTPSFHRKVNEAASKAAGKPVDISRTDN
jgi:hypothetical protein